MESTTPSRRAAALATLQDCFPQAEVKFLRAALFTHGDDVAEAADWIISEGLTNEGQPPRQPATAARPRAPPPAAPWMPPPPVRPPQQPPWTPPSLFVPPPQQRMPRPPTAPSHLAPSAPPFSFGDRPVPQWTTHHPESLRTFPTPSHMPLGMGMPALARPGTQQRPPYFRFVDPSRPSAPQAEVTLPQEGPYISVVQYQHPGGAGPSEAASPPHPSVVGPALSHRAPSSAPVLPSGGTGPVADDKPEEEDEEEEVEEEEETSLVKPRGWKLGGSAIPVAQEYDGRSYVEVVHSVSPGSGPVAPHARVTSMEVLPDPVAAEPEAIIPEQSPSAQPLATTSADAVDSHLAQQTAAPASGSGSATPGGSEAVQEKDAESPGRAEQVEGALQAVTGDCADASDVGGVKELTVAGPPRAVAAFKPLPLPESGEWTNLWDLIDRAGEMAKDEKTTGGDELGGGGSSAPQGDAGPDVQLAGGDSPGGEAAKEAGEGLQGRVELEEEQGPDEVEKGDSDMWCSLDSSGFSSIDVGALGDLVTGVTRTHEQLTAALGEAEGLGEQAAAAERAAQVAVTDASRAEQEVMQKVLEMRTHVTRAQDGLETRRMEVYGEKAVLAQEAQELRARVAAVKAKRTETHDMLAQMARELRLREEAARQRQVAAMEEAKQKEAAALELLAQERERLDRVEEDMKELDREEDECNKLREFLVTRSDEVDAIQAKVETLWEKVQDLSKALDVTSGEEMGTGGEAGVACSSPPAGAGPLAFLQNTVLVSRTPSQRSGRSSTGSHVSTPRSHQTSGGGGINGPFSQAGGDVAGAEASAPGGGRPGGSALEEGGRLLGQLAGTGGSSSPSVGAATAGGASPAGKEEGWDLSQELLGMGMERLQPYRNINVPVFGSAAMAASGAAASVGRRQSPSSDNGWEMVSEKGTGSAADQSGASSPVRGSSASVSSRGSSRR